MRVAVLLPEVEPFSVKAGAVARLAFEIGQYSEHDITIFAPFSRSEYRARSKIRHLYTPWFGKIPKVGRLFRSLYPREAAFTIKRQGHFPIIYIHNRPALVTKMKESNPESQILLHMHNNHLRDLDQAAFSKTMADTDLVISCSHYFANGIIGKDPASKTKSRVLYNGVDLQTFSPSSGRETQKGSISPAGSRKHSPGSSNILFVGRLNEGKGVHLLIEAMKQVLIKIPESRLTIVGSHWFGVNQDTPYIKNLREESRDVQDHIIFAGYVPHDQLPLAYASASVFVQPSIYPEAFPLTCLEAMASGLPVIASNRGGLPEEIGETGILFDPEGNQAVSELAQKIISVLQDPQSAHQLGEKARERAERFFGWQRIAKEFDIILKELA